MYRVTFLIEDIKNGGYQCVNANNHTFYLTALIDVFIKWISNRTIKCITIHNKNTGENKLNWKRN